MSFDIPVAIEPQIIEYAQSEHITEGEAIVRLIQAGLSAYQQQPGQNAILSDFGSLGDPMDAAILDEAMEAAALKNASPLPSGPGTPRRGPRAPIRTDNAESIIGLFANSPGFSQSIDSVIAKRSQRYGQHT